MQKSRLAEKLNINEKISLIANGKLTVEAGVDESFDEVKRGTWEEVNAELGNLYPSPEALANSWDAELVGQVAADFAYRARKAGYNLLVTSPLKVKSNPYAAGVSEDPYLSKTFASAVMQNMAGIIQPCFNGCYIEECETEYLDEKPDGRVLNDYFLAPSKAYLESGGGVVQITTSKLPDEYADVNCGFFADKVKGEYVLNFNGDDKLAVKSIRDGNLFGVNEKVLKQALGLYEYISRNIQTGEATREELEDAIASGRALSPDAIDEVVNKYSALAGLCESVNGGEETDSHALSVKAVEKSAVLLKNEKSVLPIVDGRKVAVVGEWALKSNANGESIVDALKEAGMNVTGVAQGYSLEDERSDQLLEECKDALADADLVLLFLGVTDEEAQKNIALRKTKLSANQLAVADLMAKSGKDVIAVVSSDRYTDLSFDKQMNGVLLAPLDCLGSAHGLANLLGGKSTPAGKLAFTRYDDTDGCFGRMKKDKLTGRLKVGGFIGYRRYGAAHTDEKYPFGFGLSYSYAQFKYSAVGYADGSAEVTVTNSGKTAGTETVQFYVGKKDSAFARPKKELIGYAEVELSAGESRKVNVKAPPESFAVYVESSGTAEVEDGEYTLYAGSSVQNSNASCTFTLEGGKFEKTESADDYFKSEANVLEDGYTLEPIKVVSKKGTKLVQCGAIILAVAIVLLVGVAITYFMKLVPQSFETIVLYVAIAPAAGLIAAIGLLIGGGKKMSKAKANAELKEVSGNARTETKQRRPFDQLFEEYFGDSKKTGSAKDNEDEILNDQLETLKYYDSSMTYRIANDQLHVFLGEHGVETDDRGVRKLLSAFSASRLIVFRGQEKTLVQKLAKALCAYFGTEYTYCNCADSESPEKVFFTDDNMKNVLQSAALAKHKIHVVYIDCPLADVRKFATPVLRYLKSPNLSCEISLGEEKLKMPKNMWFVVGSQDEELKELDPFVADLCCVTDVSLAERAESENTSDYKVLTYYQLNKMSSDCVKTGLDEEKCWKKVDKLEKYVSGLAHYRIGNKSDRMLERYSSAYMLCGGEEPDALDNAVADVVLPSMVGTVAAAKGHDFSAELESIFGEDSVPECLKVLKNSGLEPDSEAV